MIMHGEQWCRVLYKSVEFKIEKSLLRYVLEECSFWDIISVSAVFIKYIFIYLILKHILTGDLQNSPLKQYERKVFVNHVKEKTFQQVSKMFNCLIKIQWIKFNNMILPSPRYGFIKKSSYLTFDVLIWPSNSLSRKSGHYWWLCINFLLWP